MFNFGLLTYETLSNKVCHIRLHFVPPKRLLQIFIHLSHTWMYAKTTLMTLMTLLQLMFESSLKLQTPSFFSDGLRVVPRQVFKLVNIFLHHHISLLQCQKISFHVLLSHIWEIFLQEMSLEVGPVHLFFPGLHLLLHSCPLVLGVIIQQVGGKQELLLIAVHHPEDFLTLVKPCIRFIGRSFASELYRLVSQEILHS